MPEHWTIDEAAADGSMLCYVVERLLRVELAGVTQRPKSRA